MEAAAIDTASDVHVVVHMSIRRVVARSVDEDVAVTRHGVVTPNRVFGVFGAGEYIA